MRSLIWKDCRLNSWVLALGVATWLGPYIAGVLWLLLGDVPRVSWRLRWAFMLEPALVISLEASMLPLLLLGANAIARERSDRSAEFLAYLPPSRGKILASKAVVALAFAAAVWATGLLIAFTLMPALVDGARDGKMDQFIWGLVAAGSLILGSAWLGSSIVDTPLTAVGFSMVILLLVGLGFGAWDHLQGGPEGQPGRQSPVYWRAGLASLVGISCFAAGSWLYLRRVEP